MDQEGLRQKDLARILPGKNRVSEILPPQPRHDSLPPPPPENTRRRPVAGSRCLTPRHRRGYLPLHRLE
jgi:hypothetical protein